MRKRITLLIVALVLALTMSFGSAAAFAANAPAGCEKVRGTIVCEESGKNENQPKFQQTTFKKGSVNSSHEEEVVCGTPCPPGQFKD
jgi:Spy/CpxP family protein refolding chaperone